MDHSPSLSALQRAAEGPTQMVLIAPEHVGVALPYIYQWLEKGAESSRGIYTVQDIIGLAVGNKVQIWAFREKSTGEYVGILMTHIMPLGARPVCEILLVAGRNVRRWKDWLPVVKEWARQNGAVAIRCLKYERSAKVYSFFGFRRLASIYEDDLV